MRDSATPRAPLQWAYDLQARQVHETAQTPEHERLTQADRDAWRDALASSAVDDAALQAQFTPPPFGSLPPAMQADRLAAANRSAA